MLFEVTLITLFFSIIFIASISSTNKLLLQKSSILLSSFILILSSIVFIGFNLNDKMFSYFFAFDSILNNFNFFDIKFYFALDGMSILFFSLSSFLIFLCVIFIQNENFLKEYILLLFIIQFMLLIIFSTFDLFFFYVFFESLLIPMYLIIGLWGSRERKIRAAYLLFFYTICGSLLFLISILYIYFVSGTFSYESFLNYPFENETFLWFGFFLSFASKIPMFPFHIWLPEAHVEAPTVGSVLLAGILLKLGVYGFLRYSLVLFEESCFFFTPLVYTLSLIGIIYASLNAIRQTDLKRIIAYSSIAHMNLIMLGIFSYNEIGYEGAILQSISHGFVSGALFFLIGIIYDRYHTRLLFYYSGLVHTMPLYSSLFLIFTMANIALPGTSSFIGEFTILLGIFKTNIITTLCAATSVILSGAYSLWLYNRMIFGNLKFSYTLKYKDLTKIEFLILIPLLILVLVTGITPNYFFESITFMTIKNISYFSTFTILCN